MSFHLLPMILRTVRLSQLSSSRTFLLIDQRNSGVNFRQIPELRCAIVRSNISLKRFHAPTTLSMSKKMELRTLGPKEAAALDEELMGPGGFSIDQLMELAGISVSQAVFRMLLPSKGKRILVACGPGNNGGDGLVAARHLHHYGYTPTVYYPKRSKGELFQIHFVDEFPDAAGLARDADLVVDAIFGFSFSGSVREPFPKAIEALAAARVPVLAVDAPSSWNIETGPPDDGPGKGYAPDALISLTAPKPLVAWFKGRHFVGGRFLSRAVAERFGIDVPPYEGADQIVEVSATAPPPAKQSL